MKKDKFKKFEKILKEDKKLKEKLLALSKKTSNEVEFNNFIENEIIKIAKDYDINFTKEELLKFEKKNLKKLDVKNLSQVSGGKISLKPVLTSGGILTAIMFGASVGAMQTSASENEPASYILGQGSELSQGDEDLSKKEESKAEELKEHKKEQKHSKKDFKDKPKKDKPLEKKEKVTYKEHKKQGSSQIKKENDEKEEAMYFFHYDENEKVWKKWIEENLKEGILPIHFVNVISKGTFEKKGGVSTFVKKDILKIASVPNLRELDSKKEISESSIDITPAEFIEEKIKLFGENFNNGSFGLIVTENNELIVEEVCMWLNDISQNKSAKEELYNRVCVIECDKLIKIISEADILEMVEKKSLTYRSLLPDLYNKFYDSLDEELKQKNIRQKKELEEKNRELEALIEKMRSEYEEKIEKLEAEVARLKLTNISEESEEVVARKAAEEEAARKAAEEEAARKAAEEEAARKAARKAAEEEAARKAAEEEAARKAAEEEAARKAAEEAARRAAEEEAARKAAEEEAARKAAEEAEKKYEKLINEVVDKKIENYKLKERLTSQNKFYKEFDKVQHNNMMVKAYLAEINDKIKKEMQEKGSLVNEIEEISKGLIRKEKDIKSLTAKREKAESTYNENILNLKKREREIDSKEILTKRQSEKRIAKAEERKKQAEQKLEMLKKNRFANKFADEHN